eukprot:CAMPEP_0180131714 /NCGR_PEP_ID=MMETSP0986-20121125/8573_1 /TAXON_ID=697907 /ORGANISM="non described non described, Strain CCMP2293" /LENGTH=212 /DNA_ID=CAMNT_0022071621 /DNA_START=29 /DNA_END=667 /DNA_ORIENTATION=-
MSRQDAPMLDNEAILIQKLQAERHTNNILARQNQQLRDRLPGALPSQLSVDDVRVEEDGSETTLLLQQNGTAATGGCCCGVGADICGQRVPSVQEATGVFCLILNIFLPGTGSILAGVTANRPSTVLIGILQLVFAASIIGWIFSIWWGVLIYKRSLNHERDLVGISIYSQPYRHDSEAGAASRAPPTNPSSGRDTMVPSAVAHVPDKSSML